MQYLKLLLSIMVIVGVSLLGGYLQSIIVPLVVYSLHIEDWFWGLPGWYAGWPVWAFALEGFLKFLLERYNKRLKHKKELF